MLALLVLALSALASAANLRPLIGILTQPTNGTFAPSYGNTYIAASYVKYVEGAGALAVPVRFDLPLNELQGVFDQLSGLILPGGGVELGANPYTDSVHALVQWALLANSKDDYFPVWGTCFGFQTLAMLIAQNFSLLSNTNSENLTLALNFTQAAQRSRLFSGLPSDVFEILGTQDVTMNNHMYSLTPASFAASPLLVDFFNVLSTNFDRDGIEFVSTMEGKVMPFYATQWHPEKPIYEWLSTECMNHSPDSVYANQQMANFFVGQIKVYSTRPVSTNESLLIYNFPVAYTGNVSGFEQTYFFP